MANLKVGQQYVYSWDRMGRKGDVCTLRILGRVMGSVMVEFTDGYKAITSWRALRPVPAGYVPSPRLDFGQ